MKYKVNVIVCGPAIGKTYLKEHDDRFIDLDEIKSDYKYGYENKSRLEKEQGKLNRGKVINEDSTEYVINILEEEIKNNKIILLAHNKKVVDYVIKNNIDYCLVYASLDSADEYAERMKSRGNSDIFIEKMTNKDYWKDFYELAKNNKTAKYKLELKRGEYLSDVIDNIIF